MPCPPRVWGRPSARPSSRLLHQWLQLPDESATKCAGLTRLTSPWAPTA